MKWCPLNQMVPTESAPEALPEKDWLVVAVTSFDRLREIVRFLLKNLHFIWKILDFLLKNVDFLIKDLHFL